MNTDTPRTDAAAKSAIHDFALTLEVLANLVQDRDQLKAERDELRASTNFVCTCHKIGMDGTAQQSPMCPKCQCESDRDLALEREKAWRKCAEALAVEVRRTIPEWMKPYPPEALSAYERLKGKQ